MYVATCIAMQPGCINAAGQGVTLHGCLGVKLYIIQVVILCGWLSCGWLCKRRYTWCGSLLLHLKGSSHILALECGFGRNW